MTEKCRYFIPGPVWVRPEILQAMVRPMVGHRSSAFTSLFTGVTEKLRVLFGTKQHVFVAASSGTGLLEGALLNTVARAVLTTTCGAFSERWKEIAERTGVEVDHLDYEWGTAVKPADLTDRFRGRRHHFDAVTITHNETSTGVMNPLVELAGVVRAESADTLILVDAVSSLGGAELRFDEWDLDVCIASSQKALGLPPGLAVVAVSERAMECARKKQYRGTYFDFLEFERGLASGSTPWTPALPLIYALDLQLDEILDEGLAKRWARHRAMRDHTLATVTSFARPISSLQSASWTVSCLEAFEMKGSEVVKAMKDRGYTLGSGYGKLKEPTFRIAHMGDCPAEDLDEMLQVLREVAG